MPITVVVITISNIALQRARSSRFLKMLVTRRFRSRLNFQGKLSTISPKSNHSIALNFSLQKFQQLPESENGIDLFTEKY